MSALRERLRISNLPKPARYSLGALGLVFLFLLPNKWFYEYLGIPLGFAYIPLYTTKNDMASVLFICTWIILLSLGLNVVVGYAGLLDLGFFGFFAVGAYVVALLTSPESKLLTEYNWLESPWPWLVAVPIGIALSLLAGVLLGWPTLRLRGDYLAIVTLGFAEMIRIVAKQQDWILNGDRGIPEVGHPPGSVGGEPLFSFDAKPYYWLALCVIILAVFLIRNLVRSRVGRAWVAIREDEDAAELMGVPTFRFKLWAFAIGAAVGGLSGTLWAGQANFVNSTTFSLENSILVLSAVLLGGAGNIAGAILGGFLVIYIPEWLRSVGDVFGLPETVTVGGSTYDISPTSLRFAIFGIVLIVVMIFRPQGLWPNRRRAAEIQHRKKEVAVGE
ncbi:high-affinity branched-chain amino acid ABC transporter (LivM) [Virgisporangium aliadipatigenens]|uniref:High-affinity branched-chain amino acid ABC transporter (LivM) n=1 Tax=Virgisporangium aliadipatigenens TaxID=741659 RepID=A0A8J3YP53_9ACTN|nr:branched-chain amino acid ABC transporter permease [Virgisporangium aliadipatigenens]GIJ47703.1 high-affinity branched-chain amino acid ABC transporter (LivM) [Virgisporangium aliadipatigenens]